MGATGLTRRVRGPSTRSERCRPFRQGGGCCVGKKPREYWAAIGFVSTTLWLSTVVSIIGGVVGFVAHVMVVVGGLFLLAWVQNHQARFTQGGRNTLVLGKVTFGIALAVGVVRGALLLFTAVTPRIGPPLGL